MVSERCKAEFLYPGGVFSVTCSLYDGHKYQHIGLDTQEEMDPPTDFRVEWDNLEEDS